MIRRLLQASGRICGVESPPDIEAHPHMAAFSVAATWASFKNRLSSGRWMNYKPRRMVFISNGLPDGTVTKGDLGGWSAQMHQIIVDRAVEVAENGGVPAFNLSPAKRAGYQSINEYFAEYGHREGN